MELTIDPPSLVKDLGFLVRWDLANADHEAILIVALRREATERHFDPEVISYWRTGSDGRGRRTAIAFGAVERTEVPYSWGPIEIVDRLGVTNTFVSFGGTVTVVRAAADTVVATFRSDAPILRRGGHSQRYDDIAAEITAFFGRVLVPIDFSPGAEHLVALASPLARYAAFLQYDNHRLAGGELVRGVYGPDARLVRREAERLERADPAAWNQGGRLLQELGLA
jgi:hypothetical protein